MQKSVSISALCALTSMIFGMQGASADNMSPKIDGSGKVYSSEEPDLSLYGDSISGRDSECSELRFQAEFNIKARKFDQAIRLARKATQMGQNDPENHVILARALTAKILQDGEETKKDMTEDKELISECLQEWRLIRWHDADMGDSGEASAQMRKLNKYIKTIAKEKKGHQDAKVAESQDSKGTMHAF